MKTTNQVLPQDGTRYMWVDPTGVGRNWFGLWGLVDSWQRLWIYREWPCPRVAIPGVGLPGTWAESGSDAKHKLGGVPGPASRGFGWGLRDYKAEFARLERWHDLRGDTPIEEWDNRNGADEMVYLRYLDKRFGNTQHHGADGNTTLQDELADLGLYFELITGHGSQDGRAPIDHGVDLINNAFSYDPSWLELDTLGQVEKGPKLFIALECENLWFALKYYTALGGYSEATKDPIDCLRYAIHSKPCYVPGAGESRGRHGPRGYGASSAGNLEQTKTTRRKADLWQK